VRILRFAILGLVLGGGLGVQAGTSWSIWVLNSSGVKRHYLCMKMCPGLTYGGFLQPYTDPVNPGSRATNGYYSSFGPPMDVYVYGYDDGYQTTAPADPGANGVIYGPYSVNDTQWSLVDGGGPPPTFAFHTGLTNASVFRKSITVRGWNEGVTNGWFTNVVVAPGGNWQWDYSATNKAGFLVEVVGYGFEGEEVSWRNAEVNSGDISWTTNATPSLPIGISVGTVAPGVFTNVVVQGAVVGVTNWVSQFTGASALTNDVARLGLLLQAGDEGIRQAVLQSAASNALASGSGGSNQLAALNGLRSDVQAVNASLTNGAVVGVGAFSNSWGWSLSGTGAVSSLLPTPSIPSGVAWQLEIPLSGLHPDLDPIVFDTEDVNFNGALVLARPFVSFVICVGGLLTCLKLVGRLGNV